VIAQLGIVGRLLTIVLVGFGAILLLLGGLLYLLRTQEGALEQRFPLPAQIAAIVSLLDDTPPQDRETLLTALNTNTLSVQVVDGAPIVSPDSRELPRLENVLTRLNPELSAREVVIDIPEGAGNHRPLLDAWAGAAPLRAQVALADGSHVVLEATTQPLRRILGLPSGIWLALLGVAICTLTIVGLFRTVSPLRRLTSAIASFAETAAPVPIEASGPADMRRLIGTFNLMQERLSTLLKGRTILAGAISHDLRTYLTRMRLRIDTIEDEAERSGAEADIDAMSAIVENSLAFAQAAGKAALFEDIDLTALVREAVKLHQDRNSPVSCGDLAERIRVKGDTVGLRRVLTNLIDNALRYAGDATIRLSACDGFAELFVDDSGRGIPPNEREAIFEPFYRLDAARNLESGGTGLGLALTRQIVEAHGGRITAGTSPGGGNRMHVVLPLAKG
jgi:signal transduction histidine kinase